MSELSDVFFFVSERLRVGIRNSETVLNLDWLPGASFEPGPSVQRNLENASANLPADRFRKVCSTTSC